MITREMYDDEQYRQMNKLPQAMARSGRAKVEKDAMTPLINGFTVNGYDGVPLFSDSHPLLDSDKLGNNLAEGDRKSTRLNSSHVRISYAVFCLKKKKKK